MEDDYKDIDELCVDDEDTSEFENAAKHVQTLAANLDNPTLLSLYGYYKQGTHGKCNVPKPGWMDFKGKSKWEAWNALKEMPQSEARNLYVSLVKRIDPLYEKSSAKVQGWVTVSTLQPTDSVITNEQPADVVHFVKSGNYEKLCEYLNEHEGANLNKLDEDGLALIHWAADRGSLEILKLLHEKQADINCLDTENQSPLHYASSCGHLQCVEFLVKNGADVMAKDSDGMTSIDVAADDDVKQYLSNCK